MFDKDDKVEITKMTCCKSFSENPVWKIELLITKPTEQKTTEELIISSSDLDQILNKNKKEKKNGKRKSVKQ